MPRVPLSSAHALVWSAQVRISSARAHVSVARAGTSMARSDFQVAASRVAAAELHHRLVSSVRQGTARPRYPF
jgi:hypothetical protein